VEVIVISTETNPVVAARCQKLKIACVQGTNKKLVVLQSVAEQRKLQPEQIAYVGNDVNDLECLRWVGVPIAVADAVSEVLKAASWITLRRGGGGAVREVADFILQAKAETTHTLRENPHGLES
jgi:YrbI family 3-deoxy-D-manno-octulosonate 8-phosphate phosphatase